MLLFRERSRAWTPEEVAGALRLPVRIVRRELERLRARGTAKALGDERGFQFDGSDAEKAAALARIAALYAERRIELINYVASKTLKRIQSIADAFKLGKDEER